MDFWTAPHFLVYVSPLSVTLEKESSKEGEDAFFHPPKQGQRVLNKWSKCLSIYFGNTFPSFLECGGASRKRTYLEVFMFSQLAAWP